jgi:hypothetical protein
VRNKHWVRIERLVLSFLTVTLASLFLVEWRRSRGELNSLMQAFDGRESSWIAWAESQVQQIRIVGRDLSKKVDRIEQGHRCVTHDSALPADSATVGDVVLGKQSAEATDTNFDPAEPPLPEKVRDPRYFVEHLNVPEFFADPDFNPNSVELSPSEKVRAMTDVDIAKLQIKVLEKEILRVCAENVDRMREEGDFVQYARGQAPDPVEPGMVTYGETIPGGGMRVYYFFPEEYESIYERRERQREICVSTVRRLLSYTDTEG